MSDHTNSGTDTNQIKCQNPYPSQGVCPTCGYCPHCGRPGYQTFPRYPTYPTYPSPNWYVWTTSGTSQRNPFISGMTKVKGL